MKFICTGGFVTSSNDGDDHYLSAPQLAKLYGVSQYYTKPSTLGVDYTWFKLVPQYDGNYSLPDLIHNQLESKWKPMWEARARLHKTSNIAEHLQTVTLTNRLKFLFTGNTTYLLQQ